MSEQQIAETGDTSLREDLEKEFDKEVAVTEDAPPELLPAEDLTAGDDDPVTGDKIEESTEAPTEDKAGEELSSLEPVVEDKVEEDKAPASWSPEEREQWKELPTSAKAAVKRREREHDATLKDTAESKQVLDTFSEISERYAAQIAAEGATPLTAYKGFMEMAATLQSGNQKAKAELITRFMKNYGVSVEMVDELLVSGEVQTSTDEQAPAWATPLVNDFQQRQQQGVQNQRQANQSLVSETTAFVESKEFGADVRQSMAAIFTAASQNPNAKTPTLDEAYDQACHMNPEVRKILAGRTNVKAVEDANRASTSVTDSDIGIGKTQKATGELSLRDEINKSWNDHS